MNVVLIREVIGFVVRVSVVGNVICVIFILRLFILKIFLFNMDIILYKIYFKKK